MARNGVWELKEVLLRYCAGSGSSRGVREFVEHEFVNMARKNPQIQFRTQIKGGHPCIYGKYITGYERQQTLKNMSAEQVGETVQLLRDTLGRRVPAHNEISIGVVEKRVVSVQGVWRNRADMTLPETAETVAVREKRRKEYSVQSIIDKYGMTGLVKMTQELLENRERMRLAAIEAMPKKERVMPTE